MTEIYSGIKFKVTFDKNRKPVSKKSELLKAWSRKFSELGLAPRYENGCGGNLSFRTSGGFIITAAGSDLGKLDDSDLVEVLAADISTRQVFVIGVKEPSSESILHHEIYQRRHDINAVFHGHDDLVLRYNSQLKLPVTEKEHPYGTIALVWAVTRLLKDDYILLKNHGFLALGKDMDEAGKLSLKKHYDALKVSEFSV